MHPRPSHRAAAYGRPGSQDPLRSRRLGKRGNPGLGQQRVAAVDHASPACRAQLRSAAAAAGFGRLGPERNPHRHLFPYQHGPPVSRSSAWDRLSVGRLRPAHLAVMGTLGLSTPTGVGRLKRYLAYRNAPSQAAPPLRQIPLSTQPRAGPPRLPASSIGVPRSRTVAGGLCSRTSKPICPRMRRGEGKRRACDVVGLIMPNRPRRTTPGKSRPRRIAMRLPCPSLHSGR